LAPSSWAAKTWTTSRSNKPIAKQLPTNYKLNLPRLPQRMEMLSGMGASLEGPLQRLQSHALKLSFGNSINSKSENRASCARYPRDFPGE
jgi:hypothetical protein